MNNFRSDCYQPSDKFYYDFRRTYKTTIECKFGSTTKTATTCKLIRPTLLVGGLKTNLPTTGKQHTPIRNNADPTRKTINIIMAYPSRPPMEKGVGTGGNGGGIGQDRSQSTHEHAGLEAYK